MIRLLALLFIEDNKNISNSAVRSKYGILCGAVGIFFNLFLSLFKFIAGLLSNSIAICADAFNNLSDAASSIITLFGFKLASQKADSDHPFGHGRFEYISGLIVSVIILIMAFELFRSSVDKIIHPVEIIFSNKIVIILSVSIVIKLYMAFFNHNVGVQIKSASLKATSIDSLCDVLTTIVVLISTLVSHYMRILIDPYCGIVVSFVVAFAGYKAMKDTINPLLGQAPDKDLVSGITDIVMSHEEVIGIHDLIVHNYGPGNTSISLHAEVPAEMDFISVHNIIDHIEHDIRYELMCDAVIHMDPVLVNDKQTETVKAMVVDNLKEIDASLDIHDFRIVKIDKTTKLTFDIEVPFNLELHDNEIKKQITKKIFEALPDCVIDIEIDRV